MAAIVVFSNPAIPGPGKVAPLRSRELLDEMTHDKKGLRCVPGPAGRWLVEHHSILKSAGKAKASLEKAACGLAPAEKRFQSGKDPQALLKWDVLTSPTPPDLNMPIHLDAILKAAKGNNYRFFIRFGRTLEKAGHSEPAASGIERDWRVFLLDAWVGVETDFVQEKLPIPGGICDFRSLGLCFFTQSAIHQLLQYLGLIPNMDLDTFKKAIRRLGIKRGPRLINYVKRDNAGLHCTSIR